MDRCNVTYKGTGETTEWEDILVKKGIIPGREKEEPKEEEVEEQPAHPLENATLDELDEFEDDFDDDSFLNQYREQRIAEMKEREKTEVFGEVREIVKAEWLAEVNEASKNAFVVIHLYQDYNVECQVVDHCLTAIAKKFKAIKCLRIIATSAVENWPDKNLPCLFVYRDGEMVHQIIGAAPMGGKQMKAADLEWKLASLGVIMTEMEENPRARNGMNSIGLRRGVVRRELDEDDE